MSRFLLLVVLILIIVGFYLEGQHYNPEILSFRKAIFQETGIIAALPQRTNKWIQTRLPKIYISDNLYEYLDGQADFYINKGFKRLIVGEYKNAVGQSAIVEIYEMETPLDAWAVLQELKPQPASALSANILGYQTKDMIVFAKGRMFVKVFASTGDIKQLALNVYHNIESNNNLNNILKLLPPDAINPLYIRDAFLGIEGFNRVIEATFAFTNENSVKVFIRPGSDMNFIRNLLEKMRANGAKITKKENGFLIEDPYEGRIFIVLKNNVLYGIKGRFTVEQALKIFLNNG